MGSDVSLGVGNWGGAGMSELNGTFYVGAVNSTASEFRTYTLNTSTGALTQVGSDVSLGVGNWLGAGMSELSDGPPYTVVSSYYLLQSDGTTELEFSPLVAGRIQALVGVA